MGSFYCFVMMLVAMPCLDAYYRPGIYVYDVGVANPASLPVANPVPPGISPPGITVVSGATSHAQNVPPTAQMRSLGGPYDLDPSDYPSATSQFAGPTVSGSSGPQVAFDVGPGGPLSNSASGTVINTGHAGRGSLNARGQSNTRTDPFGSQSLGTGSLNGEGFGLTGTQINSGDSESQNPGSPFGSSSSNMFVNSLAAQRGIINGNSRTLSNTGPNGNAFGSSSGSAMGRGDGVDLSQVANSNSQGSSSGPGYGPSGPFSW